MWDHTDGCTNHHRCASFIYLLTCIALELSIIINRSFGATRHDKDIVDGLSDTPVSLIGVYT